MASANYVYNYPLLNNDYQKDFYLQYSYDKDPDFEEDYFKIVETTGPDSPSGLKISIYQDDSSFLKNSLTEPRSELRGITNINDNIQYVLNWDQYIENYSAGYSFSFLQIFAKSGPNVMLRWKDDKYELLSLQGRNKIVPVNSDINDDIGKWVNWKLEFILGPLGYIKVYKDNILFAELNGNTSGDNESYLKLGIYGSDMKPLNNMNMYIKNLELYYN
jgi:hypothetical protein